MMASFPKTPPPRLTKPTNSSSRYNNYQNYDRSKIYDMSLKDAKCLSRRLFQAYDKNRSGILEMDELAMMIRDSYKGIRDDYCPSRDEVEDFLQIHDRNSDGVLTMQDLETTVLRYLAPNLGHNGSIYEKNSPYKQPEYRERDATPQKLKFENFNSNSLIKEKEELLSKLSARMPRQSINEELTKYRSLFVKYDSYNNGHLEYDEILPVLNETYTLLGIENFNPTHSDTQRYIEKMDQNRDGRVTRDEYEVFVLKALANRLNNS